MVFPRSFYFGIWVVSKARIRGLIRGHYHTQKKMYKLRLFFFFLRCIKPLSKMNKDQGLHA